MNAGVSVLVRSKTRSTVRAAIDSARVFAVVVNV